VGLKGAASLAAQCKGESGQMMVEVAVCLPVMISVALIVINCLSYNARCSAFDARANDAIRSFASTRAGNESAEAASGRIQAELAQSFSGSGESVEVRSEAVSMGCVRYVASFRCRPSLGGQALPESFFGLSCPEFHHETSLVVNPYQAGDFL